MGEFITFLGNNLADFWTYTGFANATGGHLVMILVGLFFIYLAVAKEFEPMLLIPIGFGMLIGNIPFNMEAGLKVGTFISPHLIDFEVVSWFKFPLCASWLFLWRFFFFFIFRLVSATYFPGYRSYDGFLRSNL